MNSVCEAHFPATTNLLQRNVMKFECMHVCLYYTRCLKKGIDKSLNSALFVTLIRSALISSCPVDLEVFFDLSFFILTCLNEIQQ